jgi:hypothetical protein
MPQVRFEPTVPAFELAKTVHALDRAATVISKFEPTFPKICIDRRGTHTNNEVTTYRVPCGAMCRFVSV